MLMKCPSLFQTVLLIIGFSGRVLEWDKRPVFPRQNDRERQPSSLRLGAVPFRASRSWVVAAHELAVLVEKIIVSGFAIRRRSVVQIEIVSAVTGRSCAGVGVPLGHDLLAAFAGSTGAYLQQSEQCDDYSESHIEIII